MRIVNASAMNSDSTAIRNLRAASFQFSKGPNAWRIL
jgi:hypothetical protein